MNYIGNCVNMESIWILVQKSARWCLQRDCQNCRRTTTQLSGYLPPPDRSANFHLVCSHHRGLDQDLLNPNLPSINGCTTACWHKQRPAVARKPSQSHPHDTSHHDPFRSDKVCLITPFMRPSENIIRAWFDLASPLSLSVSCRPFCLSDTESHQQCQSL